MNFLYTQLQYVKDISIRFLLKTNNNYQTLIQNCSDFPLKAKQDLSRNRNDTKLITHDTRYTNRLSFTYSIVT